MMLTRLIGPGNHGANTVWRVYGRDKTVLSRYQAKETKAAYETILRLDLSPYEDFHQLSRATVEALLEEADKVGYRKPTNANGSRVRYFHARLMRFARQRLSVGGEILS